jgi:hypothetical protein
MSNKALFILLVILIASMIFFQATVVNSDLPDWWKFVLLK